jgi:hypothetical protein
LESRGQYEVSVPIDMQQGDEGGSWSSGIGDIELAIRRTLLSQHRSAAAFSPRRGGRAADRQRGTRPRQRLHDRRALRHVRAEHRRRRLSAGAHPASRCRRIQTAGQNETFVRTALGYSLAQDRGFGRSWSPMMEVLFAKPRHDPAEWDVVPQLQISLSKLQHVLLGVGMRVPLNEREDRKPQFLTYFLWDWFDGGLLQFWK